MAGSSIDGELPGGSNGKNSHYGECGHFLRGFSLEILAVAFFVVGVLYFLSLNYYTSSVPYGSFRRLFHKVTSPETIPPIPAPPSLSTEASHPAPGNDDNINPELLAVLRRATTTPQEAASLIPNKTVILVTITEALARPGSMLDLFLESFWVGNRTQELLRHLVIVSLDHKAHQQCQAVHPHCYEMSLPSTKQLSNLTTDALFMTQEYLVVVWRKIELVASVLQLGYDLLLTDADIMWFRNPFPHLAAEPAADIQVACDTYRGSSSDPNTGFLFVRTNNMTIQFLKHWYESRVKYPEKHDQDVFNHIIRSDQMVHQIGLRMRFLDTAYFGGFCEPVKDLSVATTMHANCCVGMGAKVHDLRNVLNDWKHFSSGDSGQNSTRFNWRPPRVQCHRW